MRDRRSRQQGGRGDGVLSDAQNHGPHAQPLQLTQMEYRALGQTDLRVSVICLGTMTFGEQNDEVDAHAQLDFALDNGVNFIDTAEMYAFPTRRETQGRTEECIGSWLVARGSRDRVVIATKASGPGDHLGYIRGGPRLNREHLTRAVEESLRRLRTDYIDLYQLHWPERDTNFFGRLGYEYRDKTGIPIAETLGALGELVRQGKIRHVGVSNESPWGVAEFLAVARASDLPRIVSIQNPYSLLNRTFEVGLAEFSHREQVGLLAYSPLAMGALSGKYLGARKPEGARMTLFPKFERYGNPRCQVAIQAYVDVARRHGLDPAQMALAFVNSRPFVTSTIIGATTMGQLGANLESAGLDLSDEVLGAIEAIHRREPNPAP